MSWDQYIDYLIEKTTDSSGTVHCNRMCIIGLSDGNPWNTTLHPKVLLPTANERMRISQAYQSENMQSFQSGGIYIEKTRFQYINYSIGRLLGKAKKKCIVMFPSKSAILIARTTKNGDPGLVADELVALAKYLDSLGY